MPNLAEALKRALSHHQAGRVQAAEQGYRKVLAADPRNADALHLLGVALLQQGRPAEALDPLGRAVALRPSEPKYQSGLADAHRALRQWDQAAECYQRAIQLRPNSPEAHFHLANALRAGGHPDQAVACYQRAVQLRPGFAEAHLNLGNTWRAQGRLDQAVACYQQSLQARPDYAEALNNLGTALQEQGLLDRAVECYQRAVQRKPDYAEAHSNLGNAWRALGRLDQAVACYRQALQLRPDHALAHNNLGIALQEQRHLDAAIECFRRAVQQRPDFAEAYGNLANALKAQGRLDEARDGYQRALQLAPRNAAIHTNLGGLWQTLGDPDRAIACYRAALQFQPHSAAALAPLVHQLQHACAWDDLTPLARQVIDRLAAPVASGDDRISPFYAVTLAEPTTAPQQLQCAQAWAERCRRVSAAPLFSARVKQPDDKITLGYLSADFHAHATAWLVAELIERHDRSRFAVHAYSYGPDDGSPMRRRLTAAFDRFVDMENLSFAEAAQRIAADRVDILIDLKGYTTDARPEILALRPAPIQVNYLGYPATMGAPFVDYILVDDFIVPADQQPHFTERLVHLPGCYQANDSRREIAAQTPTRAEAGLPSEGFVFCCFNNSYKITPALFDVWMRLLNAVPGSVLWLLERNPATSANLRREAAARGVPAERLVFGPKLPLAEHLARHRLADLFLDTYPVAAHTTASDALWAGCPLLALVGPTLVSRVSGSLLRALGLPELIATSLSDYEQAALCLAQQPERLAALRARLQSHRDTCGLFDGARFARHVEQAYQRMWTIHASGTPPQPFAVSAGEP